MKPAQAKYFFFPPLSPVISRYIPSNQSPEMVREKIGKKNPQFAGKSDWENLVRGRFLF
jgi:hypothetical protein